MGDPAGGLIGGMAAEDTGENCIEMRCCNGGYYCVSAYEGGVSACEGVTEAHL